jgi:hypothetical protein
MRSISFRWLLVAIPSSKDGHLLQSGITSKLASKQATIAVQPHAPPRHKPALEEERILMDFTSTQARTN